MGLGTTPTEASLVAALDRPAREPREWTGRDVILRLGLALAVVLVTLLALLGRIDPATAQLLVVVHAVLAFTALAVNIAARRRLRRSIDLVKTTAPVPVDQAVEPILVPRDDVAELMARLRELGFELVGATDTTLRVGPDPDVDPHRAQSGDVFVELGYANTPIAIFLSQARGGRFVETSYPRGATIDVPQLLAGPVASSPADALATQRERLASLGGPGRSVVTMADYLAVEADQRASNGGMRIRHHLDRVVEPAIRDFAISLVIDTIALGALLVERGPVSSGTSSGG